MAPVGWGVRWVDAVATVAAAVEPAPPWSWLGWVGAWRIAVGGLVVGRPRDPVAMMTGRWPCTSSPATTSRSCAPRSPISSTELVGDGDRSLMVDEFDGDDYELRSRRRRRADAAVPHRAPGRRRPRRRPVQRRRAGPAASPTSAIRCRRTELVLVGGGGRLAKALTDAVKAAGGTGTRHRRRRSAPGTARRGSPSRPRRRACKLSAPAASAVAERLGEDVGRLDGILETLAATYGDRGTLQAGDVEPFLGEAGGVPPWDLTDAIDRGDTAEALACCTA